MQEFSPYSEVSDCALQNDSDFGKECNVTYTLDYDFDPPIYFHYKLTEVYQNHRSYVKSRNTKALINKEDVTDVEYCDPSEVQTSKADDEDYAGKYMLPCGLIANSFFNDKFKVKYIMANGTEVDFCDNTTRCNADPEQVDKWSDAAWYSSPNWERDGIAWDSDLDRFELFEISDDDYTTNVNQDQEVQNVTLPDTDDPDLMVWMRTSTVPTFLKLHRIINGQSLKKGDQLMVTIKNYFNVNDGFDGTKALVISTNSSLGGRNNKLGIIYMVIGSVSLLTAVFFRILLPPQRLSASMLRDM